MVDLRRPVEYNSVLAFKKSLCQFPEINHFLWERCVGEGYLIHYLGRSGRKHLDSFKEKVMVGQRLKGWRRVDLGDGQEEGQQKPRPAAGEQVLRISLCLPRKQTHLWVYMTEGIESRGWLYDKERCWESNMGWWGNAESAVNRKPVSPLLEG